MLASVNNPPDLGRRVAATTQALSLLALTATGSLVSWFAAQARATDQLKTAESAAPARPRVVPVPVQRPVRTVVVRRVDAAPGAPAPVAERMSSSRTTSRPVPTRPRGVDRSGPPARTANPPATKSSGS